MSPSLIVRAAQALILALLVLALRGAAQAHEDHQHSSSATSAWSGAEALPTPSQDARPAMVAPPQGQVKLTARYAFDVRYAAWGMQIFVNDPIGNPVSPRGVAGDVVMEVGGDVRQWRFPIEYIAADASPFSREHLLVRADLSRVRNGDMVVLIDLMHLPHPEEPGVRFAQTFALTPALAASGNNSVTVTVVPFGESDRLALLRQRTCPVTNDDFSHGPPIKLLVGAQTLFVCCEPCIEQVRMSPERYLRPIDRRTSTDRSESEAVRGAESMIAAGVTAAIPVAEEDRELIIRQRDCPITNQPLGAHGVPLRVTAFGRTVYVCCAACVPAAERLLSASLDRQSTSCSKAGCTGCRGR